MAYNVWNWMLKDWPQFSYDAKALEALEYQFSENSGTVFGVLKHVQEESKDNFLVEVLSDEAIKTSEIEGEYLNRDSVQSSIKKNLGLAIEKRKIPPAEFGISEMMVDLYLNYDKTLTHEQLFSWHKMITNGRRDIKDIGCYRTHEDPMQVVSGRLDLPKVHFEAPPSKIVPDEMEKFVSWFNQMHQKDVNQKLLPLAKAGIAHLYFVSIHPFEDGNGRIGRAIAEKSIAQSTLRPSLISLSSTIDANKKSYYAFLEKSNTTLEITDWLVYFSKTILEAQEHTLKRIDFLIEKTRFFDRFSSQLNERQLKVVKRLFDAGHKGFKGGLSANNYQTIAKTSASTATRDLQDLINKQILIKTGTLKSTRYFLNIEPLKSSI
ncbi:Fic family protein [uncultured Draconibacterium sp.]|uniref:Fic family protein n=1 Tax=uncultured Draconibacterium sp. TaxID=1573823 RepID=UPI002AA67291|nr:Fic family protein [uncultured Draconibacterium sp.]